MISKTQLMNTIIVWADELLETTDKAIEHIVETTSKNDPKVREMGLSKFRTKRIEYETMVKLYHWDVIQYDKDMKGDVDEESTDC